MSSPGPHCTSPLLGKCLKDTTVCTTWHSPKYLWCCPMGPLTDRQANGSPAPHKTLLCLAIAEQLHPEPAVKRLKCFLNRQSPTLTVHPTPGLFVGVRLWSFPADLPKLVCLVTSKAVSCPSCSDRGTASSPARQIPQPRANAGHTGERLQSLTGENQQPLI